MKNLKLLTKESFVQAKNKIFLLFFYLVFLSLTLGVIVSLVSFTFSFSDNVKHFIQPNYYSTLEIKNKSFDIEELVKSENEDTYFNFLKTNLKSEEEIKKVIDNDNFVDKDNEELYLQTQPYYHNLYGEWIWKKFKNFNNLDYPGDENILNFRSTTLNDGKYINKKLRMHYFNILINDNNEKTLYKDGENKVDLNNKDIWYDWQVKENEELIIDKKLSDFSWKNFNANSKDIIVTPTFLKVNKLELGDKISVTYKGYLLKDLRIVATGTYPYYVLSDVSDVIFLNPFLYNSIYRKYPSDFGVDFNIMNKGINRFNQKQLDTFYTSQNKLFSNELLKSFNEEAVEKIVANKIYSSTPMGSFITQFTLYNLLTWTITVLLLILLLITYRFIQNLIITSNKDLLINLKSMGFNKFEISYYLSVSFMPIIILGSIIGFFLSVIFFYMLTKTVGHSMGIVFGIMPNTYLGYIIFGVLIIFMILINCLLAFNGAKGNKLNINERNALSNNTLFLLSFKKIFGANKYLRISYSFQIINFVKAISVGIISLITLTVLMISMQFLSSVNDSLDKKPFIYQKDGESLSYEEYAPNQIVNSDKQLNKEVTSIYKFEDYLKENKNKDPFYNIVGWITKVKKEIATEKIYNKYFDEVDFISKYYIKNKESIDKKIENDDQITSSINKIIEYIELYNENFGKDSKKPIILFKNRVKTNDFINYVESHETELNIKGMKIKATSYSDEQNLLKNNEITINRSIANQFNLKAGDELRLEFKNKKNNHVTRNKLKAIVKNIDDNLSFDNEVILNFDKIRESNKDTYDLMQNYYNGVVSKSFIPYDLQYFVIPVKEGKSGEKIEDYDSPNKIDMKYVSLPFVKEIVTNKTIPFERFINMISIFLVIINIFVIFTISILISYENKGKILTLKTLGYSKKQVIYLICSIYAFIITAMLIVSYFLSGFILDNFSSMTLEKVGIAVGHDYSLLNIFVPIILSLFFMGMLIYMVYNKYLKTDAKESTFTN